MTAISGPPRRTADLRPACEFCGVECTGARNGDFRQVTGWVETRAGGGAHGVTLPEPSGRVACAGCMALLRRGIDPTGAVEQGALL